MRKTVIYSCPFVPGEWIAAHGFTPSRIVPASSLAAHSSIPVPGTCPYVRAFAGSLLAQNDAAAVVVSTMCDQMRRAADILSYESHIPVFLMNLPHTWQTSASRSLYQSELKRLGRFLVRIGGVSPSRDKLIETTLDYDRQRRSLRGTGHVREEIPVALIGGPMVQEDMSLFAMIEESGGYVALDATENGERGLAAEYDRDQVHNDPLSAITDAYFYGIKDPFRRPNDAFFHWLKEKVAERQIRGVILRRFVWCDNWHAEAERIRESLGLPFLHLDVSGDGLDGARTLTRVQALMEMLR